MYTTHIVLDLVFSGFVVVILTLFTIDRWKKS